jgi:hypothetical protein
VTAKPLQDKQFLDRAQAAALMRELGFDKTTENTIRYHAYVTHKLAPPKIVGRRAYWSAEEVGRLIGAL